MEGRRPRDLVPLIFSTSANKKDTVAKALSNNEGIAMEQDLSADHIVQFFNLWSKLEHVELIDGNIDTIVWKLSGDGCHSTKSAYNAHFIPLIYCTVPNQIWRQWAPPKCKLFTWLVTQNRIWTADRLERHGWQNCGRCKLCNEVQESAAHLLFKYLLFKCASR